MKKLLAVVFFLCAFKTVFPQAASNDLKYDLSRFSNKWLLPPELKEISGNTWIDQDHLLVIEDVHPMLYLLRLADSTATIEKKKFFKTTGTGIKFDVEDLTVIGNTVYALWSHGKIYKVSDWENKPQVKEIPTFLNKKNNTEGICYDPVSNSLLIACKNESGDEDEKKSVKAIYQFDLKGDSLKHEPFMLIHKKDFKEQAGEKIKFYPSAIAVHPVTGDIYILSTKDNKCMAVFTHSGKLKSFQSFNIPGLNQPEGICFSPAGKLFISTEGRHGSPASIYAFDPIK